MELLKLLNVAVLDLGITMCTFESPKGSYFQSQFMELPITNFPNPVPPGSQLFKLRLLLSPMYIVQDIRISLVVWNGATWDKFLPGLEQKKKIYLPGATWDKNKTIEKNKNWQQFFYFLPIIKKISFAWTRLGYFYKKITTIKKLQL